MTYSGPIDGYWILPDLTGGQTLLLEVKLDPGQSFSLPKRFIVEADADVHIVEYEYLYEDGELFYSHDGGEWRIDDYYCAFYMPGSCSNLSINSSFDGVTFHASITNPYPTFSQSTPCPGPTGVNASGVCEYYASELRPYFTIAQINGYEPVYGTISYRFAGSVPEPGAWIVMILGLGAVGVMLRRRRPVGAVI